MAGSPIRPICQPICRPIVRSINSLVGQSAYLPPTSLGSKLIAWYSPRDRTSVFQDTAGSTPVTADGQEIQRINDKSGNGFHLTKSGGAAACFANTGYRTTAKCATFWPIGAGSNFVAAGVLNHATTNRNYFLSFRDRGLANDPYVYYELAGAPDFYLSPSRNTGLASMYTNTVADGGGARSFTTLRNVGWNNVLRFRFNGSNIIASNPLFSDSQGNGWPTPTNIQMTGQFYKTCFHDQYDLVITDDTLTAAEITNLNGYLNAASQAPTTFSGSTNIMLFGDSLTAGKGSQTYRGWPMTMFDSMGYEPRWSQLACDGAFMSNVGNLDAMIDPTRTDIAIIWLGTNDIYNLARTAAQVQTDLETWVTARLGAGVNTVYVLTMIKRQGAIGANETSRTTLNGTIASRAGTVGYTVIDVAANAAFSNTADTTYYDADTIHLTNAGYAVVASLVKAATGL